MKTLDHIIQRLETRNMSVPGLKCVWCSSCLRTGVIDPKVKGSFELIWPGDEDCRQLIKTGPIMECISDLVEKRAYQ